eukprot:scaffold13253_cov140-Isochrysis_galbana.AAC.4
MGTRHACRCATGAGVRGGEGDMGLGGLGESERVGRPSVRLGLRTILSRSGLMHWAGGAF